MHASTQARMCLSSCVPAFALASAGECRKVIRPYGLTVYREPCEGTFIVGFFLTPGQEVTVDRTKGHVPNNCPTNYPFCWIYITDGSGRWGWVISGAPSQPQTLPCGQAPGEAYVSCCSEEPCDPIIGGTPTIPSATHIVSHMLGACALHSSSALRSTTALRSPAALYVSLHVSIL